MPIYEYECLECHNQFETLVKSSSDPVNCGKCHSDHVQRKLSKVAAAVVHGAGGSGACEHAPVCPGASAGACGCGCGHHHH